MRISNQDNQGRSSFVYNYEDSSQAIALASKPMDPGENWDYDPPANGSGRYTVLIKRDVGGGSIMASGSAGSGGTFVFDGQKLNVS